MKIKSSWCYCRHKLRGKSWQKIVLEARLDESLFPRVGGFYSKGDNGEQEDEDDSGRGEGTMRWPCFKSSLLGLEIVNMTRDKDGEVKEGCEWRL